MTTTTKLPDEQAAIDQRIIDEIFAFLPEDWNAFLATIEPRGGLDGGGETITIRHPEVAGAEIEASDDLRAAVAELVAWFASIGRRWDRLSYAGHVDGAGTWRLKITAPLP